MLTPMVRGISFHLLILQPYRQVLQTYHALEIMERRETVSTISCTLMEPSNFKEREKLPKMRDRCKKRKKIDTKDSRVYVYLHGEDRY